MKIAAAGKANLRQRSLQHESNEFSAGENNPAKPPVYLDKVAAAVVKWQQYRNERK